MLGMSNIEELGPEIRPDQIDPGQALRVVNRTRGTLVVRELLLALDPWSRMRGLLGRPPLVADAGLLLRPCSAVHSFFMSYAIDVVFLDRAGHAVALRPGLPPWRLGRFIAGAYCALELVGGRAAATGTRTGDLLIFELV
jgi:hypothetical protein